MIWILIYVLVGILEDFLGTLCLRFVIHERTALAVGTTFVITIISLLVFYSIFVKLNTQTGQGIADIVAYSIGIAIGTYLGMKIKIGGGK